MEYDNVDHALPRLAQRLRLSGSEVGSRLGERTLELLHEHTVLEKPWQREVLTPHRNANIAAQIAETMWVLSGRDDVEWLSHYLPRAKDFSDDGLVWRGAYGPRLRAWRGHREAPGVVGGLDQIKHVIDLLSADRSTRRAVISIYDPTVDSADGKDIPCNDFLSFISRDGYLHLSVFVRSNDLIWGWSGINAFEWSVLQEIIAGILGLRIGRLVFNTTSLHLYDRHWEKARKMEDHRDLPIGFQDSPAFSLSNGPLCPIHALDDMFTRWFSLEGWIRAGGFLEGELEQYLDDFPEPMMRSWLRVIAWYWSGEGKYLRPLEGTRLWAAVQQTPQSIKKQVRERAEPVQVKITVDTSKFTEQMGYLAVGRATGPGGEYQAGDTVNIFPLRSTRGVEEPLAHKPAFVKFVDDLHREKSAAYGDSWKKRGELMSIIPNIGRKIDRLEGGKSTEDEVIADTAVDLLVYLIKYRLWLREQHPDTQQVWIFESDAEEDRLRTVLDWLNRVTTLAPTPQNIGSYIDGLVSHFDHLATAVDNDPHGEQPGVRLAYVSQMLHWAFMVARYLWERENTAKAWGVSVADYQNPYRNIKDDDA